ncbi:PaaX family transcriptional regulator C-terminal domain-containing protein [Nocardioides koreensis]|uniref:PaaX family transcriptional regulator C-terminal domain-containing protein n=1 Tax=Nocardioides koreensis TaxID=433651 RepID=A0ABN3A774_9ACTN
MTRTTGLYLSFRTLTGKGWQTPFMHARSALFDVYGDHLRARGNQAPVAALVRMLDPVGIAAPAVRTAISRMVMQGWLEPVPVDGGRGYRATERATRRLDEAADRIYRRTERAWDGTWHLVFVTPPDDRSARHRLRADLGFVGYAELADNVWVSPFVRTELAFVLERGGARARSARAVEFDPPPVEAWDLGALRAAYEDWLNSAGDLITRRLDAHHTEDEGAFAARFELVHEWRKFLFADPGLPDPLLPADWPGRPAAELFAVEAERLKPAADRFVARCLDS